MSLPDLPVVDLVFFAALLVIVLSSRRAHRPAQQPLLSSRTLAGIALAFAALFAPQQPPGPVDRKRAVTPPAVPAVAQQQPDAGADAAAPASPAAPSHGALLANSPVYAADHTVAVDVDPAEE